ncbi:MAG: hypothetical protein ABIE84_04995, partial [bacterium]
MGVIILGANQPNNIQDTEQERNDINANAVVPFLVIDEAITFNNGEMGGADSADFHQLPPPAGPQPYSPPENDDGRYILNFEPTELPPANLVTADSVDAAWETIAAQYVNDVVTNVNDTWGVIQDLTFKLLHLGLDKISWDHMIADFIAIGWEEVAISLEKYPQRAPELLGILINPKDYWDAKQESVDAASTYGEVRSVSMNQNFGYGTATSIKGSSCPHCGTSYTDLDLADPDLNWINGELVWEMAVNGEDDDGNELPNRFFVFRITEYGVDIVEVTGYKTSHTSHAEGEIVLSHNYFHLESVGVTTHYGLWELDKVGISLDQYYLAKMDIGAQYDMTQSEVLVDFDRSLSLPFEDAWVDGQTVYAHFDEYGDIEGVYLHNYDAEEGYGMTRISGELKLLDDGTEYGTYYFEVESREETQYFESLTDFNSAAGQYSDWRGESFTAVSQLDKELAMRLAHEFTMRRLGLPEAFDPMRTGWVKVTQEEWDNLDYRDFPPEIWGEVRDDGEIPTSYIYTFLDGTELFVYYNPGKMIANRYESRLLIDYPEDVETEWANLNPVFFGIYLDALDKFSLLQVVVMLFEGAENMKEVVATLIYDLEPSKKKISAMQAVLSQRQLTMSTLNRAMRMFQRLVQSQRNMQNTRLYNRAMKEAEEEAKTLGNQFLDYWSGGAANAVANDRNRRFNRKKEAIDTRYQNYQREQFEATYSYIANLDTGNGNEIGEEIEALLEAFYFDTGSLDSASLAIEDAGSSGPPGAFSPVVAGMVDQQEEENPVDTDPNDIVDTSVGGRRMVIDEDKLEPLLEKITGLQNMRKLLYLLTVAKEQLKKRVFETSASQQVSLGEDPTKHLTAVVDDLSALENLLVSRLVSDIQGIVNTHNSAVNSHDMADYYDEMYWNGVIGGAIGGPILGNMFVSIGNMSIEIDEFNSADESNFGELDVRIEDILNDLGNMGAAVRRAIAIANEINGGTPEVSPPLNEASAVNAACESLDNLSNQQWEIVGRVLTTGMINYAGDEMVINGVRINDLRDKLMGMQNLQRLLFMMVQSMNSMKRNVMKISSSKAVWGDDIGVDMLDNLAANVNRMFDFKFSRLKLIVMEHN